MTSKRAFHLRFPIASICMIACCMAFVTHRIGAEESLSEERKVQLFWYVKAGMLNPNIPHEYGRQLIPDLLRLYRMDPKRYSEFLGKGYAETFGADYSVKQDLVRAVVSATKVFDGYEEAKLGRALVYELINSGDVPAQERAMYDAAILDGEGATDALLAKLRYPDDSVRIAAASLLGDRGRIDAIPKIEQILQERIRGVGREENVRDYSLEWMRTAISKLKDRANGIDGPSVSERMSAKDEIERGEPAINPPNPSHGETPPIPQEIANEPAKAETPTAPAVITANASTPSSAFLWTGAGVTIALLVGLVVFWQRRV